MKLIYATVFDSNDIRNWSGLGVYYWRMLRDAGFQDLSSLSLQKPFPCKIFDLVKAKLGRHLGVKEHPIFNKKQSHEFARMVQGRLGNGTHILSPNSIILASIEKDIKKILYTDSTLDNLLNFYANYRHLDQRTVQEAQDLEQQAINNSNLLIYTSQWAADSATDHYGADPTKVFVVPFGANLRSLPNRMEVRDIIKNRNVAKHLNLLFLGVDWLRKGGDYAVEVLQKLNESGIPATLHLVGLSSVPAGLNMKNIINHGFISKRSEQSELKLRRLIAASDFLLLPSLADCTPVAFSEANAFGVPCLASRVGGHASIIKDDINGKTFPHINFAKESVKYITELVEKENAYKELCYSSYNEYISELNWKSTGEKIAKLIKSI
jgi:glycosyltransferase involved in cell wall biosynthesis